MFGNPADTARKWRASVRGLGEGVPPPPEPEGSLLLESGDVLLLETGDELLLEG